jgi:hypothetical protein
VLHNHDAAAAERLPRLMALLLDLPLAARRSLAERWHAQEDAPLLYRTMTDPAQLTARLSELPAAARSVLTSLRGGPAARADLLARLPLSEGRLDEALAGLAALGLVLRAPEAGGRAPRLAVERSVGDRLYVAGDVQSALDRGMA